MHDSSFLGHRWARLLLSVTVAAVVAAVASCAPGDSGRTDGDADGSRPLTSADQSAQIAPPVSVAPSAPASPQPGSSQPVSSQPASSQPASSQPGSEPAATVSDAAAEEILVAVDEIGLALRRCYQAAPDRCDSAELDAVLLPNAYESWLQRSDAAHANGDTFENAQEWSWAVVGEPTADASNVVLVTVCVTDPIVHRADDGTVIDDAAGPYLEQWQLIWMARWKLASSTPIDGDVVC